MIENGSIFIEITPFVVKVFEYDDGKVKQLQGTAIPFRQDFDKTNGVSTENEIKLINFLEKIHEQHPIVPIKAFARSFFDQVPEEEKERFIDAVFAQTGIEMEIMSQDMEQDYIIKALTLNFAGKALVVDVSADSTKLIVIDNKQAIETRIVDNLGIGTVITKHPEINNDISGIGLGEIVSEVNQLLPELENKVSSAIYLGSALYYMQIANYPLRPNEIFNDPMHPSMTTYQEFVLKNDEIISQIPLSELEALSPSNKKWMRAARAKNAIAQAIFSKYQIQIIIPSNVSVIDGIIRTELSE